MSNPLPCDDMLTLNNFQFEFISTPTEVANGELKYRVTGLGGTGMENPDLSHLVVGLGCPLRRFPSTLSGTISVDGGPAQNITVEVRPPNNPDPPTGLVGLKPLTGVNKNSVAVITIFLPDGFLYEVCEVELGWFGGSQTFGPGNICGICCVSKGS